MVSCGIIVRGGIGWLCQLGKHSVRGGVGWSDDSQLGGRGLRG